MATTVLYPPITLDALPAFVKTSDDNKENNWNIYFAISDLVNINPKDYKVQYSIVNQKNNKSILNIQPNVEKGIRQTEFKVNESITTEYKYYITLTTGTTGDFDFILNNIDTNTFFKIQLRFVKLKDNKIIEEQSEWSRVCLLKWLEEPPQIQIQELDDRSTSSITLTNPLLDIIGTVDFNSKDSEYLKSYRIQIYDVLNNNNLVIDSGDIYTNSFNPNEINYSLKE